MIPLSSQICAWNVCELQTKAFRSLCWELHITISLLRVRRGGRPLPSSVGKSPYGSHLTVADESLEMTLLSRPLDFGGSSVGFVKRPVSLWIG